MNGGAVFALLMGVSVFADVFLTAIIFARNYLLKEYF